MTTREWQVPTSVGAAEVELTVPGTPATVLLVLGHGAGGSVDAPDLAALRAAVLAAGAAVARVTQPYRVAGRRTPPPAARLDSAWTEVIAVLRGQDPDLGRLPLVVGGRSSGARVACRTAAPSGAVGVVALAFPLHPPGRPERSRAGELETSVPTVVVNGDRDPFGVPAGSGNVRVVVLPGERHDLKQDPAAAAAVVVDFLRDHGWVGGHAPGGR